jgi:hypothetical protein
VSTAKLRWLWPTFRVLARNPRQSPTFEPEPLSIATETLLRPTRDRRDPDGAQASRHATDRIVPPPRRAFDNGLRPGPFPDRPASLLSGLLAVTRAGLSPEGYDELTDTKIHHGVT